MKLVVAALCGIVFAVGLGISGMTDPERVIGFLDFTGRWDPSLAFVMGGALGVYCVLRRATFRPAPVLAERFDEPNGRAIDRRLLAGSALFGAGWGLSGYCPGPAIVGLATGASALVVAGMIAGMAVHALLRHDLRGSQLVPRRSNRGQL
jgi:uncharacterized protein